MLIDPSGRSNDTPDVRVFSCRDRLVAQGSSSRTVIALFQHGALAVEGASVGQRADLRRCATTHDRVIS